MIFALAGVTLISSDRFGRRPVNLSARSGGRLGVLRAGAVLVRRFPRVHPVTLNAVDMTAGALVLLAASKITGDPFVLPQRIETWPAARLRKAANPGSGLTHPTLRYLSTPPAGSAGTEFHLLDRKVRPKDDSI